MVNILNKDKNENNNSINSSFSTLGIFAGNGELPFKIIEYCQAINRKFIVICFKGQQYDYSFDDYEHCFFRIGAAQKCIDYLKQHQIQEIVFAGYIKRPNLTTLKPDLLGVKILAKIGIKAIGDDTLLKILADQIEYYSGAKLIAVQDLYKTKQYSIGCLNQYLPLEEDFENITRANEVLNLILKTDIGQGLIIQSGIIIAVEAIEGTDEMLKRSKHLLLPKGRGLLIKKVKPQQSRKLDLPTIGLQTLKNIKDCGLNGLVISSKDMIVIDEDEVIEFADKNNIFIYAIE